MNPLLAVHKLYKQLGKPVSADVVRRWNRLRRRNTGGADGEGDLTPQMIYAMENPVKTIAGGGAAYLGVEELKKLNEPDTQVPDSVQEPVKRTAPHQKGVKEEDVLTWNKSINKFESGKESAQVAEELEELALTTGVTDVMEEYEERTIPLDVENELKELGILSDTSYTIQKGDTLSEIAERHSRGVEELMEMNPQIKDADQIFAGDSLQLGTLIKSPFDAGIAGGLGDYASGTPQPMDLGQEVGGGARRGFIPEEQPAPEPAIQPEPTLNIAPYQADASIEPYDFIGELDTAGQVAITEINKIAESFNIDPKKLIQSLTPSEKMIQKLDKIQQEEIEAKEDKAKQKSEANVLAQRAKYKKAAKERQAVKEKRPVKQVVKQKTEKKTVPKKKEVKVDKTQQKSEAKVLAKREEYKESSKKRELASEERMKKNLVEQAKKANVEKEVAQLDKTTEKAMSKELWLGKSRVAKQGYFSLFAGGPKVSKKVYDEHLKSVINSYIEQEKKREEETSTGLEDIKQYPDKRLLERLRDLEFRSFDKKLGSIEKKEMATIKQEIKNRNRTPPTYRRGYKLKPLPVG